MRSPAREAVVPCIAWQMRVHAKRAKSLLMGQLEPRQVRLLIAESRQTRVLQVDHTAIRKHQWSDAGGE